MRLRAAAHAAAVGAVALATTTAGLLVLDRLFPPDLDRLDDRSVVVVDSEGELLRAFAAGDGRWRLPVDVEAVDPRLQAMLIGYEDRRFPWHPGIDPLASMRALWQWIAAGEIVSGGSTLTMQTVRLLEPRRRTLGSKLVEMARALQLEWRYSKARILSIYLTLAPYGGNIEGIRAATLSYFGKEPERLTDAEAALLVALPQSPERLRPDRFPSRAVEARDRVLQRLASIGLLSLEAATEARQMPVPAGRRPAVVGAPHLAQRLLGQPGLDGIVRTTIEGSLQRNLETLAQRHQRALERGATLAILVVDSASRVLAYIGSADFMAETALGQNDMVRAVRSPGSALKPFIYGLAFDELLLHPETLMADVPTRFGDYAPQNFDRHYRGEVTAREALQLSLNVPAVATLDRLGAVRFAGSLAEAGVPLHLPQGAQPGLPIALGGVGATLEELVTLYAALSAGGEVKPLRYTEGKSPAVRLVSPLAAWYVTDILRQSPLPENLLAASSRKAGRAIAFKTGTSYGYRDAWAFGYDGGYTVGVWVGRPDGSFSPGRMGRDSAAPILFEVFDRLPDAGLPPGHPPDGALLVSNSGLPPGLRRFGVGPGTIAAGLRAGGPTILFPVDGSTLELRRSADALAVLPLRAGGGELPLFWLVNGAPVTGAPFRRQTQWTPDGPGFARITVIDGEGRSASAAVWLQ